LASEKKFEARIAFSYPSKGAQGPQTESRLQAQRRLPSTALASAVPIGVGHNRGRLSNSLFQAALDTKARSSTKSWTDVARELGYHDQMHMIHDFEEFTGETPTQTLRLVEIFFRQQIEAIRMGMGANNSVQVPRLVI
jgi:AraC-like DNA-binding protein